MASRIKQRIMRIRDVLKDSITRIIKLAFKKWDRFAFLLSLYGATAFAVTTLIPTLLDPLLHNPIYGTRTYPLGTSVIVFSGLVFILLHRSNVMERNLLGIKNRSLGLNRGCFSFLSILLPMILVLPNFLPELPHMWVFGNSVLYGASVAFASFLHNYRPDYNFVEDDGIDPRARIELVRAIYNTYYVGLALFVTMCVGSVGFASTSPQMYTNINEQIILHMAGRINLVYNLFGLIWGMAYQVFGGMSKAQQQLRKIKQGKAE